jgi:D-alanyl-D-alanine dipeptidase
MKESIILIADPRVLAVPIKENNDPLINLLGTKMIPSDMNMAFVRKEVFNRLQRANSLLPNGYGLCVREGLRSLSVQTSYFEEYQNQLKQEHPAWDAIRIRNEASKFVASPDAIPPHTTGAAVDLTIEKIGVGPIDMGTLVNDDPGASRDACFTNAENISEITKTNRKLLMDVMSQCGFINYPTEWWHWSYGDRYWAFTLGKPFALYGAVNDPSSKKEL